MITDALRSTTLLGFDYGLKRIGVAVGQRLTRTATPLAIVPARAGKPDWELITHIIDEWAPGALVVGIPYHMDGCEQEMTRAALNFCHQLEERYRLPVHRAEERLSSYIVETGLPAKAISARGTDSLAAQVILQDWLQKAEYK